jgi:hypothetical protein
LVGGVFIEKTLGDRQFAVVLFAAVTDHFKMHHL